MMTTLWIMFGLLLLGIGFCGGADADIADDIERHAKAIAEDIERREKAQQQD